MNSRSLLLAAGATAIAVTLSACEGLKEAMTAHVDTVARAGSQELTVDRLVTLLDEAKVPPRKDVAQAIANAWLDYQLLGQSAAQGDTSIDPKDIDRAMWAALAGYKARKYYDVVSKSWGGNDADAARRLYENGDALAASHILFLTKDKSPAQAAAAEQKANALRGKLTAANFAELARANSEDPGSKTRGGSLGLFRKGQMVPAFEQALLALKPGEISPVIKTDFGYHIIRRPTFQEVQGELMQASKQLTMQASQKAFVEGLEKNGKVEMRADAATTARTVMNDPDAHVKDGSTIATSTAGKFTAGRLAEWLLTAPPMQLQAQRAQLQAAPDSVVSNFVKQFVVNELVLRAADSLKLGPTPQEVADMHRGFVQARNATWMQLGVDPRSLADSGKNAVDRARIAGTRIERYMDALVTGRAQFAEVPPPISRLMREKAEASINTAGLDRAVERAVKARAKTDSTTRAAQPPSAVPIPEPGAPAGAEAAVPAPAPAPAPAR